MFSRVKILAVQIKLIKVIITERKKHVPTLPLKYLFVSFNLAVLVSSRVRSPLYLYSNQLELVRRLAYTADVSSLQVFMKIS